LRRNIVGAEEGNPMNRRLAVVLCSVLAACGEDLSIEEGAESLEMLESALTTTLLEEDGLRLAGASADRTRVALCSAANEAGYGSVRLVDLTAKRVVMTGPVGPFCGPFDPAPIFDSTGSKMVAWSWDEPTKAWELLLWSTSNPAQISVLAVHPGVEQTNELKLLLFAANGGRLVYAMPGASADGYRLMVHDFATGRAVQVSADASLIQPRLSPDGSRMVFFADGMGERTVVSHVFATGASTVLGRGHDWTLTSSPDGARLALRTACDDDGAGRTVCELRDWGFDSQSPRLVATGVEAVGGYSPHGDRIAYVAEGTLVVATLSSSAKLVVDEAACWGRISPDGLKMLWLSSCSQDSQGTVGYLKVGTLEAGAVSKVKSVQPGVAMGSLSTEPAFAPDSRRLLFDRPSASTGYDHYSFDAASSFATARKIAGSDLGAFDGQSGSRVVSPDGRRLVYEKITSWASPFCPWGSCGYRELRARDLTSAYGSDRTVAAATSYSGSYAGLATSAFAVSPGNRHLVYMLTNAAGVGKLYVVNTSSLSTTMLGMAEGGRPELSVALGDGFAAVVTGKALYLVTGLP
jgi:Tol biopolymer transport system component